MSVPVLTPEGVDEEQIQKVLEILGQDADAAWNGQVGHSEEAKKLRARALGSVRSLAIKRLTDLGLDECNAEEIVHEILRDAAKSHIDPPRTRHD